MSNIQQYLKEFKENEYDNTLKQKKRRVRIVVSNNKDWHSTAIAPINSNTIKDEHTIYIN